MMSCSLLKKGSFAEISQVLAVAENGFAIISTNDGRKIITWKEDAELSAIFAQVSDLMANMTRIGEGSFIDGQEVHFDAPGAQILFAVFCPK